MNLTYAVDRLFESGWMPAQDPDLDRLDDGRRFPSVLAVQREFARAGLELSIKHTPLFHCYRAAWSPVIEPAGDAKDEAHRYGTVIGACEREAAVYALAHLRQSQAQQQTPAHAVQA